MEAYFIEKGEEKIFCVYHPPKVDIDIRIGVVLCYPLGQEYIRLHKSYAILANKLSDKGIHVMRFDYQGSGDSYGKTEEITTIEYFEENIRIAINELRDGCDLEKIYLLGARLGGTLCLKVAQSEKIHGIVLWSPVLNGVDYIKEISNDQEKFFKGSFAIKKNTHKECIEYMGFLFNKELIEEIKTINVVEYFERVDFNILLLSDRKDKLILEIENKLGKNKHVAIKQQINNRFWIKQKDDEGKSLVPVHDIEIILKWLFDEAN